MTIRPEQSKSLAATFFAALFYCILILEGSFKLVIEDKLYLGGAFWTEFLPIKLFPSEVLTYFLALPISMLMIPWVLQKTMASKWTLISALYFTYGLFCMWIGLRNGAQNNAYSYFKVFHFKILLLPLFVALASWVDFDKMCKLIWSFAVIFSVYVNIYGLFMIQQGMISQKDMYSANFTGLQLMLLPCVFGFYEYYQSGKLRWAIGSALLVSAIIIPLEKPAISSLVIAVILAWSLFTFNAAFISMNKRANATRFILGAGVFLVLGFLITYVSLNAAGGSEWLEYIEQRFLKVGTKYQDVSSGRFEMWAWAMGQWLDSPVIGQGIGIIYSSENQTIGVHNAYIEALYTTGIVGFLFYLSWLYIPICSLYGSLRRLQGRQSSAAFTFLVWLGVLILSNAFGAITAVQSMSSAFFMIMAFAARLPEEV